MKCDFCHKEWEGSIENPVYIDENINWNCCQECFEKIKNYQESENKKVVITEEKIMILVDKPVKISWFMIQK